MHSEYLRRLYLNNDLAEGRLEVAGKTIAPSDIRGPIFAVGAERDHVAPWKSVYKIRRLTDTDVTFALASGGHNGGIVSEPGRPHRHYRIRTHRHNDIHVGDDDWAAAAEPRDGSWWEAWAEWLSAASGTPVTAPGMGNAVADLDPLCDAPGTYVFQD
jgi:polyhydroxyalkanoate synthase